MAEITSLMERDSGASTYFANAKGFFEARDSVVVPTTGTGSTALADVFKDLRVRAKEGEVFGVINLVSHAMTFSALQFPVSEEQRVADRTRTRRQETQARRRIARGLPPVPQESERRREPADDDAGEQGLEAEV